MAVSISGRFVEASVAAFGSGLVAEIGEVGRDTTHGQVGWHSLRRKFVNDMKADTPMADLCYLGGWKSPLTVMTVYQHADQATMRNALSNRDQRRGVGSR